MAQAVCEVIAELREFPTNESFDKGCGSRGISIRRHVDDTEPMEYVGRPIWRGKVKITLASEGADWTSTPPVTY